MKQPGVCVHNIRICASDISERVVEEARRNAPDVHFSVESVYDIRQPDASFDLVVASEVLEHLEQPEAALTELLRISKKYIILSVPNEPVWRVLNMARGKYIRDFGNTPGHIQHWSKNGFIAMAGKQCHVLQEASPFPWTMLLCEKRS